MLEKEKKGNIHNSLELGLVVHTVCLPNSSFCFVSGGQVLHSTTPHPHQTAHRPQPLVRQGQADTEGNPQHTVRGLHEPHGW